MKLVRIKDIGEGYGPCNAYDGNTLCGEWAEWIAESLVRRGPDDKEWEPLRFCKRHWARTVREQAAEDQEEAFLNDHGYPEGGGLPVLICHLGCCIDQERAASDDDAWRLKAVEIREQAEVWLKNWILEHQEDTRLVKACLEAFENWVDNPSIDAPLIDELIAAYEPNCAAQFRAMRVGMKFGIPRARRLLSEFAY